MVNGAMRQTPYTRLERFGDSEIQVNIMKRMVRFRTGTLATLIVLVGATVPGQDGSKPAESDASKLVYADFQNMQTGRPSASRAAWSD